MKVFVIVDKNNKYLGIATNMIDIAKIIAKHPIPGENTIRGTYTVWRDKKRGVMWKIEGLKSQHGRAHEMEI
jgi:hypothetical protein